MSEDEVKAALERWLLDNTRTEGLERIPHDRDIVTGRVVDSLRFIDLVLLIEELSGLTVDVDGSSLDDFRSIDAIWGRFFAAHAQ